MIPLVVIGSLIAAAATPQPVRLQVEAQGGMSIVRVIAQSPVACSAAYELAVTSSKGGNRSVNRGRVTIAPGEARTVATVKLAGADKSLVATLSVSPSGGRAYEQVWPSAD